MTTEQDLGAIVPTRIAPVSPRARAEALSWAPSTRRAYVAGSKDFTSWCLENRCAGLPSAPANVGRYLEDHIELNGRALVTARLRLAAIAAAHRLGKHPETSDPLAEGPYEAADQGSRQATSARYTEAQAAGRGRWPGTTGAAYGSDHQYLQPLLAPRPLLPGRLMAQVRNRLKSRSLA